MSSPGQEAAALRPLWSLVTGMVAACAGAAVASSTGPAALRWVLAVLAVAAIAVAVRRLPGPGSTALWLLAGLALGGARGLTCRAGELDATRRLADLDYAAVRIEATVVSGWTRSRWGRRALVSVANATQGERRITLPRSVGFEVRGAVRSDQLPAPGSRVRALAGVRQTARRPLLVASSAMLVETVAPPRGLHLLRDRLAQALFVAGGTRPKRIRAAELAAALALGRRDLVPAARRDAWRRSGLAHLLAVSGLHVGLVAGVVWLLAVACGLLPNRARIVVLAAVAAYVLVAGAAPSAVRAALMVGAYLGARLAGRAIVPMAAVLVATTLMLLAEPALISDAGFQLTVGITAALVRWVPPLARRLPGPAWLAGAAAVPVVAQLAAVPIVAWHFRTVIPGAVVSNLLAPFLLTPTLVLALGATLSAAVWPAAAALGLTALSWCATLLLACGSIARARLIVAPPMPALAVVGLAVAAVVALRPGRTGRFGAVVWAVALGCGVLWWFVRPGPAANRVTLLPVADGLAALLPAPGGPVLVDGGRWRSQAAELVTQAGVRRLSAVVASHTDEDHIGGLERVLSVVPTRALIFPAWMASRPEIVPLLRTARRHGTREVAVARGSVLQTGGDRFTVLWPPAVDPPRLENDRSLVARINLGDGDLLLTSDISAAAEHALLRAGGTVHAAVLVVAHHGSRGSSTQAFLNAVGPRVALVPAAPLNTHHHPHEVVLNRLRRLHIPFVYPARDGWCGAVWDGRRWRAAP